MQTVTSGKVQSSFGAVVDIAKSGEPVTITQYGRPTLMLFSYAEGEALLRLRNVDRVQLGLADRMTNIDALASSLTIDDVNDLVHELRS